ncbi:MULTISPECIES: MEDS domain-containing protein [Amycolatopsis]|uniref:DcmR-like sensory protein n=2 Tax=Amycolatopsis TaxID=1813 RepID=A0A2N3X123_9PSEU|nr:MULTISPECIES: MEDS domain-containing protein [Amycolatopsis]MBB2505439.1 MEDS domain-containing protein [Amycolatopsis echigonensis]PKV99816.1 DcmR-like sensory protein [Amycolatopsis niigatensis]WIV60806.1 MEDS domain-containing protein [Amycolatopsis sp. 2-2]
MTTAVSFGVEEIRLGPGSHVCAFYRGAADRDRLLTGYLSAGLEAGDKCICVVDSARTAQRLTMLAAPPAHDTQLDIHLPEATYLAGGRFGTAEMLTFWSECLDKAQTEGYGFSRIVGEMTWALRDAPGVEHLVDYEWELNRLMGRNPTVVLCLYDLDLFNGEVVVNIVKTHPLVFIQGMLVENPYYVGPDEVLHATGT